MCAGGLHLRIRHLARHERKAGEPRRQRPAVAPVAGAIGRRGVVQRLHDAAHRFDRGDGQLRGALVDELLEQRHVDEQRLVGGGRAGGGAPRGPADIPRQANQGPKLFFASKDQQPASTQAQSISTQSEIQ